MSDDKLIAFVRGMSPILAERVKWYDDPDFNPSAAKRSATAAPMPREAPVTTATLLDSLVIFSLLWFRGMSASDEKNLNPSEIRIIM